MNDPILYINNYPIDYDDVIKWPELEEEINFDSSINIPDSHEYVLDNSNPSKYDPKYSGSLLYGTQIFGLPVSLYDSDLGKTVSRGIIKNISTASNSKELTIEATSQLSALSDNDCQLIKNGITPAEAMYQLLTSPITIGSTIPIIDPSLIDVSSFKYAAGVQKQNRCTVNINIVKDGDNNKKYSDVLPELLKIGHCFIYSHYDRIYLYQYRTTNNVSITISDIIAGSYKDSYSLDDVFKIRNSYNVAYFSGENVFYATGKDMSSIQKYGESIFGIPSDDVNSDSSVDFNIGIDNYHGARWCGETALDRFKIPALICNFSLDYSYNTIKIGDVIGLNFDTFGNTPVLILSASYDRTAYKIEYKGLFL